MTATAPSIDLSAAGYRIRRQFWSFFGARLLVTDPDGRPVLYVRRPTFAWRDAIYCYSDAYATREVFRLVPRAVSPQYGITLDLMDPAAPPDRPRIGALRRHGFKSLVRDEWGVLDADDRLLGLLREDSQILALIRRLFMNVWPQKHELLVDGRSVAVYKQNTNPLWRAVHMQFAPSQPGAAGSAQTEAAPPAIDRRLCLAGLVLLYWTVGNQKHLREEMGGNRGWRD